MTSEQSSENGKKGLPQWKRRGKILQPKQDKRDTPNGRGQYIKNQGSVDSVSTKDYRMTD